MGVMTESVFKAKKRLVFDMDTGEFLELEEMQAMENSHVVYRLTHIPTKKTYIGRTDHQLKERLNCHHIIGKNAKDFTVEILYEVIRPSAKYDFWGAYYLDRLEAFEIESHDSFISGLNRKKPNQELAFDGARMLGLLEGVHP